MTRKRDNRGQGRKLGNIYHIATFPPTGGRELKGGGINAI